MQNKLTYSALAMALLLSGTAAAETTSEALTRIEAETMVLTARQHQLEVQANIIGKQNEIAARQSVGNVIAQPVIVGDPVILGVEGVGRAMFATLQLNDGSVIDVQAGDTLPNGMKIVSIRAGEVVVRNHKNQMIRLASYSQATNNGFNINFPAAPGPGAQGSRGAVR